MLRNMFPRCQSWSVTDGDNLNFVRELIDSGVRGYIPTTFDFATFKEAIQFVAAGGTFVPASVLHHRENGQVSDVGGTDRKGMTR